jgi:hypothetical protein
MLVARPSARTVAAMELPLPKGGRVTHILHLADTHIRTGDETASRCAEYREVFRATVAMAAALPAARDGTLIVLIAGDVFHTKSRLEARGMELFLELVGGLLRVAPVFIMRGNHDYSQSEARTAPDILGCLTSMGSISIAPELAGEARPRLVYLDRTGSYICGNVGFGLVAIQDALRAGNTRGYELDMPEFPPASRLPDSATFRVALFHGAVTSKCALPNGGTLTGVPLDWFGEGYDAAMLGDVHLQQLRNVQRLAPPQPEEAARTEGGQCTGVYAVPERSGRSDGAAPVRERELPWAFPGSLVQQDMGEPLLGHGFLVWNVVDRRVAKYHVNNSHGLITMSHVETVGWLVQTGITGRAADSRWLTPVAAARQFEWFPREVTARVKGLLRDAPDVAAAKRALQAAGLVVRGIYPEVLDADRPAHGGDSDGDEGDGHDDKGDDKGDDDPGTGALLLQCNTPDAWIKYIEGAADADMARVADASDLRESAGRLQQWTQWLKDPVQLQLPSEVPPCVRAHAALAKKIAERDRELANIAQDVQTVAANSVLARGSRSPLKLVTVEWEWILCYGDACWFDFTALRGSVGVLNARNGCGKTSLMDIVCWGIFGTGIPSRDVTDLSSSLLCRERPPQKRPWIAVVVDVNGTLFRIHRPFDVQKEGTGLAGTHAHIVQLSREPDDVLEVASGGTAVLAWVKTHIGTAADFLLSAMLTQHNDNEFFCKKDADQVKIIDDAIGNNVAQLTREALKKAALAHAAVLAEVNAMHAGVLLRADASAPGAAAAAAAADLAAMEASRLELTTEIRGLEERRDEASARWLAVHGADAEVAARVAEGGLDGLRHEAQEAERLAASLPTAETAEAQAIRAGVLQEQLQQLQTQQLQTQQQPKPELVLRPSEVVGADLEQLRGAPPCPSPCRTEEEVGRLEAAHADWEREQSAGALSGLGCACDEEDGVLRSRCEALGVAADARVTVARAREAAAREQLARAAADVERWRAEVGRLEPGAASPKACRANPPSADPEVELASLRALLGAGSALTDACAAQEALLRAAPARPARSLDQLEAAIADADKRFADRIAESDSAAEDAALLRAHERLPEAQGRPRDATATVALAEAASREAAAERTVASAAWSSVLDGRPRQPSTQGAPGSVKAAHRAWQQAGASLCAEARSNWAAVLTPAAIEGLREGLSDASSTAVAAVRDLCAASAKLVANAEAAERVLAAKAAELQHSQAALAASEANAPPFNPACEACRAQPWKVQLEAHRERVAAAVDEVDKLRRRQRSALVKGSPGAVRTSVTALLELHRMRVAAMTGWMARATEHAEREAFWADELLLEEAMREWKAVEKAARARSDAAASQATVLHEGVEAARAAEAAVKAEVEAAGTLVRRLANTLGWIAASSELRLEQEAAKAHAARTLELASADAQVTRLRAAQERVRALEREGARRRLLRADGCLQEARGALEEALEEVDAALGARAAAEHTRRAVDAFLDERARVWGPQAAETRALRAAWAQWGPWQARVRALETEHIAAQLAEAREQLKLAASAGAVHARAETLRRAVADGPDAHRSWVAACTELAVVAGRAQALDQALGGARMKAAARAVDEAVAVELATYADTLQSRLLDIRMLNTHMDGFRAWLFTNVVAPLLEREVNRALAMLQAQGAQARQLALVVSWKDNGAFGWGFRDGALPAALPLGKASGFQRASIGLCMRIALARVGCMGIVSRHLFIDEGFTASDSDNMACVPQFLRALLAARYDTVLLVSHIEGIKDCADVVVPITRFTNERGVALSRLQFGARPADELALPRKPRGRPPANAEVRGVGARGRPRKFVG